MVNLDLVHKSNSQLQELGPGLVAVFVGGTSGIGEATLKAFIKHTISSKAYIVGRNETEAIRIVKECSTLNPSAEVVFIKGNVAELKEVDRVCAVILERERHLNLLVQTHGTFNVKGRDETLEGLDRKLSLNYYSKTLFITNLLPLLRISSTTSPRLSRVLSVVSAGNEGPIDLSDLDLKKNFSGSKCWKHSVVMTDLMMEEFSTRNPGISFIHSSPGLVYTPILDPKFGSDLPFIVRTALKFFMLLVSPFSVSQQETGERQLFIATSPMYPAKEEGKGDVSREAVTVSTATEGENGIRKEVVPVSVGADGVVGSGVYLIGWNGEVTGHKALLEKYRKEGVGRMIWEHTVGVFERVKGGESGI